MARGKKEETPALPTVVEETGAMTVFGPIANYAIVTQDADSLREVMAANAGDRGISEFDLDRVKVPSGGGTVWQVPSLEGERNEESIEGVIVFWKEPRAYWAQDFDSSGGGTPPDCSSGMGDVGIGIPGGDCSKCPLAAFGSAEKNGEKAAGQACKQMRMIFLLREGGLLPIVVTAPPTSLGNARQYFLRLSSNGVPFYGVKTRLRLKKDKNKQGIAYSKIEFEMAAVLPPPAIARIKDYAAGITGALRRMDLRPDDVQHA